MSLSKTALSEAAKAMAAAEKRTPAGPDLEFMECDTCRAKPGTPDLCHGCLHNREVISKLKRLAQK